jgi:hypothetical protein
MTTLTTERRLRELAGAAFALRGQLVQTLLSQRREDDLFPAKPDDERTTLSVSAMVALALHEAHDLATPRALRSVLDGPRKGPAYCSHDRSHTHILATAWPVLACTQIDPHSVEELAAPAKWLVDQGKRGAYSYTERQPVRAFYSGVVLLALASYLRAAVSVNSNSPAVRVVVEESVSPALPTISDWLTSNRLRGSEPWQWPSSSTEPAPCLVSTTAAYAGLQAATSMDPESDYGFLQCSSAIRESLLVGLAAAVQAAPVPTTLDSAWKDVWPWITETAPSYWFRFFTPLLALSADDGLARASWVRRKEVLAAVAWVVDNSEAVGEMNLVWTKAKPGRMELTLWAAANAVILLSRFIDGVGRNLILGDGRMKESGLESVSNSQVAATPQMPALSKLTGTLSKHYPERSAIKTLLLDAQIPIEEVMVDGTGRVTWDHIASWVAARPVEDIALRVVIARDKPELGEALLLPPER